MVEYKRYITLYDHLYEGFADDEAANNELMDKLIELENLYDQLLADFNTTAFKINWSEGKLQYKTISVSDSYQGDHGTASITGTLH